MRAPCGPALLCVALLCSTPQCWGTRSDELLPSEPRDAAGGATSGVVHRGPPVLQYAQPPIHPHCLIDGAAAPAHPRPRGDWGEEWLALPYGGDVAASDGHRRAEGPGAEGHARLAGEEMALRLAKQAAAQAQRAAQEDQAHRASVSAELDEAGMRKVSDVHTQPPIDADFKTDKSIAYAKPAASLVPAGGPISRRDISGLLGEILATGGAGAMDNWELKLHHPFLQMDTPIFDITARDLSGDDPAFKGAYVLVHAVHEVLVVLVDVGDRCHPPDVACPGQVAQRREVDRPVLPLQPDAVEAAWAEPAPVPGQRPTQPAPVRISLTGYRCRRPRIGPRRRRPSRRRVGPA